MKSIKQFMTEKITESLSKEKLRNDWDRLYNAMDDDIFINACFNFLAKEKLVMDFVKQLDDFITMYDESLSASEEKKMKKEWDRILDMMTDAEFIEQIYNFMDEATLAKFIRYVDGFMGESVNEDENAKIKELEKKLDKVEDKAEEAEDAAEKAEDKAKKADKEASKAEESVKTEKDFRSYAENKFKTVFGDKLDKDEMNKVIDGIIKKYKDGEDWGEAIGTLNKSFGN